MDAYLYAILGAGWLAWCAPFLMFQRNTPQASIVDRRARWGMLLLAVAYSILWQSSFWERSRSLWRITFSIVFFLLAILLSWSARRSLGRQWRIDAGLNADHKLVTAGPYRVVRHPIYTSMLCVLLGTGVMITPWWLLLVSLVFFLAGTEIRVRVEDRLLNSRFGDTFRAYQNNVPAYIPFLR
jgi:protein-S-isoprenylcysteine O-methyltransferase Ste14